MCEKLTCRFLSIASWNINGLKNKSIDKGRDPELIAEIKKHHMVCLSETHTGNDYTIEIDGFDTTIIKTRPICKKINKYYGGMILCIRKDIKHGTVLQENTSTECIWVKIGKKAFNLTKDLYVGFNYILPGNSTHLHALAKDPIEDLDRTICSLKAKGNVLVMGDLNGRTGLRDDFIF